MSQDASAYSCSDRPTRRAGHRGGALIAVLVLSASLWAAQPAWATTPLTGETVTGAGPSTGGSTYGNCVYRGSEGGSMGFSASGTATGPYTGSFTESGSFSLSGYRNPPWSIHFSASFTITSGATTITGTFASAPYAWWSVGFICNSSGGVAGYSVSGRANYTATINGQPFQGTATVGGTFYATAGAQDSVSEDVTVTYGQISGLVTDAGTKAALAGICVHAYNSSGGVLASSQTDSNGGYTLTSVPAGSAWVGFSAGCGASNYLTQYYSGEPSLASATAITVPAGTTAPGVNAAMAVGAQITGAVTAKATSTAIAGICVQAYNSAGAVVASSQTSSSGTYTLSALPTGSYLLGFLDCQTGTYVTQYYNDEASLATADPIFVTVGTTRSGINAAMVIEGQITGTVTDNAGHAPLAGICVDTFGSSGSIVASVLTDASGTYATPHLSAGDYRIGFFNCGGTTYIAQYYNAKATLATADPVAIKNGITTSGINAALVAGA